MTDDRDTDADAGADTSTCESCGRTDEVVAPVHRVYLTPTAGSDDPSARPTGSAAREPEARVEEAVEHWCASCRENYPHVPG